MLLFNSFDEILTDHLNDFDLTYLVQEKSKSLDFLAGKSVCRQRSRHCGGRGSASDYLRAEDAITTEVNSSKPNTTYFKVITLYYLYTYLPTAVPTRFKNN